jgi:hypothetical protein
MTENDYSARPGGSRSGIAQASNLITDLLRGWRDLAGR